MNAKDFRVWWAGSDKGWMIDTEFGLSRPMMQNIADYTLKVQKQRLIGLRHGPKRDECLETIKALESGRISQNIAGKGERVLFDAYKSDKVMV